MEKFKECDMYLPLKHYFEEKGYAVNSEVHHCDLTARKDEELIIVEIKKNFNMSLLYQAIDRQKLTDMVFVAIPRYTGKGYRQFNKVRYIVSKLGIGLMTVAMDSPVMSVEVEVLPAPTDRKQNTRRKSRLLKELAGRSEDLNTGGSNKTKIMTAYRERCIQIACALQNAEPCAPVYLVKNCGCTKETGQILRNNIYGWFERRAKGIYALSEEGRTALNEPKFKKLVDYYSNAQEF